MSVRELRARHDAKACALDRFVCAWWILFSFGCCSHTSEMLPACHSLRTALASLPSYSRFSSVIVVPGRIRRFRCTRPRIFSVPVLSLRSSNMRLACFLVYQKGALPALCSLPLDDVVRHSCFTPGEPNECDDCSRLAVRLCMSLGFCRTGRGTFN